MNHQIKITRAGNEQRQQVVALLQSERLPVDDLPASFNNFFVASDGDRIIGAVGLEQYEHYGLLRSMVVDKEYRNKSIASQLVHQLESFAATLSIDCMYLLTETASVYFEAKGYEKVSREETPEELKSSSEFSHVCPVSAVVMKKPLAK